MIWNQYDVRLNALDNRSLADIGLIRRDSGRTPTYDVVEPCKLQKTLRPRIAIGWNLSVVVAAVIAAGTPVVRSFNAFIVFRKSEQGDRAGRDNSNQVAVEIEDMPPANRLFLPRAH